MTCNATLTIVISAGAIYTAIGLYALYRQHTWMAEMNRRHPAVNPKD